MHVDEVLRLVLSLDRLLRRHDGLIKARIFQVTVAFTLLRYIIREREHCRRSTLT